jgi:hypothetical protein
MTYVIAYLIYSVRMIKPQKAGSGTYGAHEKEDAEVDMFGT